MLKLVSPIILFLFAFAATGQNVLNPYSDFGYIPKNQYISTAAAFTVENKDTAETVSRLIIDVEKMSVLLYRKDSTLLGQMPISEKDILRFLSVDPLTKKYPELTPYQFASNQPIWAIDLDGEEAKVKISTEVTGYTVQRLTGILPAGGDRMVVVPTFRITLTDAQHPQKIVATGNVTRDSWYSRGQRNDGNWELINRHFEPADANVNLYTGERRKYPLDTDLRAYRMTQYNSPFLKAQPHTKEQETHLDGSPIDEARPNYSQASNVYFHIGGMYQHTPQANTSLAASYGCFGFVASPQIYKTVAEANDAIQKGTWNDKGTTNAQYLQFMQNIQTVRDKYDGTENDKVLFEIIKRINVKETSIKKF